MKTEYELHVAGLTRKLKLYPISNSRKIAAFILLGDAELCEACARELIKRMPEHDIMLTAEAKSIPLAHEMARQAGEARHVIARKGVKVYMQNPIAVEVQSITTASKQKLYLGEEDAQALCGKKVLIVDDVISTGKSLQALEELVAAAGGEVAGKMAVLAEGDAAKRGDILFLQQLPLFDAKGDPILD